MDGMSYGKNISADIYFEVTGYAIMFIAFLMRFRDLFKVFNLQDNFC